ncbi:MAG: tetratricopeptide repeat protein [Phycisphaerae bacterium]|nr:tetratricopeptide repeat protein [Phycisphaerae bacterium]
MKKLKHVTVILVICTMAVILTGCNDAYANKKQGMETRWEKSAASAKIPVMEDLIDRGQIEEAKKMLAKSLPEDPQLPQLHLLSGRIHFIEGRTEQARQDFHKAVELDSTLAEGWHLLGSLAMMEKDYDLALAQYNKALELLPANADYRVGVSEVLLEQGQIDEARETLRKGLQYQPRNLDLLLTLAQLNQQLGEVQQAIEVYEQAQLMHGNDARVLEPSGYAYVALRRWSKAAEKFEELLIQCEPETTHYNVVLRSLAMCSFNAENYDRALTCYDRLSVVYRDDPEIWIGMAQSALGLDDMTRAVYCANRVLKFKSGWAKAYAVLGSALYLKADYERSLDTFDKITTDDEYAAFAWFMTGRCYRQLGQTIQANSAFERAEQLDPDNELITMFLKRTLQSL